ncbi:MAG TPA: hypothetical protein DEF51_08410 [Myxococcales bacterium]|nr:hypothetical protein [Myxococcales bacterium]
MSREKVRRGLVTIAAIVVLIAGMRAAASIVVPILLALFLAFVSSPLVFRLSKTRMPYPLAVSLVLLLELAVLGTLGVLIGSSVGRFEQRVPVYRDRLGELYRELADFMSSHGVRLAPEGLSAALDPGAIMEMIGTTLTGLGAILGNLLLVVLVLAFTLFDASRLWRKVEAHFAGSAAGDHVLTAISAEINRYLSVKSATSITTGVLLGVWCAVMGVDFAVLWGLLAFLLNYIPTVGSLLAAIPPVLVALVVHGPGTALAVAGGYVAVNVSIGNVIEPRLMGRALGISPVVVLLSIVLWGWVLGPVGALLSVPLTMILKIALSNTTEWAWTADLMSGPVEEVQEPIPEPSTSERSEPGEVG